MQTKTVTINCRWSYVWNTEIAICKDACKFITTQLKLEIVNVFQGCMLYKFWDRGNMKMNFLYLKEMYGNKHFQYKTQQKLILLRQLTWLKKNVTRATTMKFNPPAKSVSLSNWKVAAILKNITCIVTVIITQMPRWRSSKMWTTISETVDKIKENN